MAERGAEVRAGLLHAVQFGLVRTGLLDGGEGRARRFLLSLTASVDRFSLRLVGIVDVVNAEQQEPVVGRRLRLSAEGEMEARVRVGIREATCSSESVQSHSLGRTSLGL